jgi:hypothetical protein
MDRMSKFSFVSGHSVPIGSLWERTATAPPATKQLDLSLTTDVAVIGGGYTRTWTHKRVAKSEWLRA